MSATTAPPSRLLHAFVLMAGTLCTLFWPGSLVQWWMVPNARRDGFEMMGVVLSTVFFLLFALPVLVLGLRRRGLRFAAVLGAVGLMIASDVLRPWIPWGLLR